MGNKEGRIIVAQRVLGVVMIFSLFIYLVERGQEVPDIVGWLLALGVGSLIVGVDNIVSLFMKKK